MSNFKADNLWIQALETTDEMTDSSELRNRDLTSIFLYELEQRVKNKEQINININGPVRSGKSVGAMAICMYIKKLIEIHHKKKRPMGNKNISRDQNEYGRIVKRRKLEFKHECDVIDEWSEMELTGYNATIEEKFLKQFSDVQAARYYHRIACSPQNVTDSNCDILLQTIPGARAHGKTPFLLSYRLSYGDTFQPVLIGHIKINVQPVLEAIWYKEYLRKKEEKWELMNKHNVQSPRELEYAQIILNVYHKTKEISSLGMNRPKDYKIILEQEASKLGVWFSILGDKEILDKISSLGQYLEQERRLREKLIKTKKTEEKEFIQRSIKTYNEGIRDSLQRLYTLTELWKQYQLIEEK